MTARVEIHTLSKMGEKCNKTEINTLGVDAVSYRNREFNTF